MSFINIISAVGNNRGVAPLFVRDCCIEIPTKLGLTYNQNLKDSKQTANNAFRERFIDEYGTSAIWICGPIVLDKFANKIIKKCGYNAGVNMSLFKERKDQGILLNIKKFKDKAPDAVKDLEKALANKSKYQNLQAGKFALSTLIPIGLMGFLLPKLNFKLTEKITAKQKEKEVNSLNQSEISFKGLSSTMANMSHVNKMAVTDGGLTIGRVWTGRNRYEQMELGFKNVMMMFPPLSCRRSTASRPAVFHSLPKYLLYLQETRSPASTRGGIVAASAEATGSELIATVNYHSSGSL